MYSAINLNRGYKIVDIEELEIAVESLSENQYDQFRRWFFDLGFKKWDEKIEWDSDSGKLAVETLDMIKQNYPEFVSLITALEE